MNHRQRADRQGVMAVSVCIAFFPYFTRSRAEVDIPSDSAKKTTVIATNKMSCMVDLLTQNITISAPVMRF